MILPTEQQVMQHVRAALTAVSKLEWNNMTDDGIASEIAKELKNDPSISSNAWCYSGKRSKCPDGCDGPEFRFDF